MLGEQICERAHSKLNNTNTLPWNGFVNDLQSKSITTDNKYELAIFNGEIKKKKLEENDTFVFWKTIQTNFQNKVKQQQQQQNYYI